MWADGAPPDTNGAEAYPDLFHLFANVYLLPAQSFLCLWLRISRRLHLLRDAGAFLVALHGPWDVVGKFNADRIDLINSGWFRWLVAGSRQHRLHFGLVLLKSFEVFVDVEATSDAVATAVSAELVLAAGPGVQWTFSRVQNEDKDLDGCSV